MSSLLGPLLDLTSFRSALLRNAVPCAGLAFAVQAAFALPAVAARSERLYDLSGALTNVAVAVASLYLPALRLRAAEAAAAAAAAAAAGGKLAGVAAPPSPSPSPSLAAPFAGLGWRQVVLTAAAVVWAVRLGTHLFTRIQGEGGRDSRFDALRGAPRAFFAAWMAQALWGTLCLMPVVALNAVYPCPYPLTGVRLTDAAGLALYGAGLAVEVVADAQKARWQRERREKVHDEEFMTRGLWSRSQYPNYFGETMLWTGVATTAAGVLVTAPAQAALGLGGGVAGRLGAAALAFVSPGFTLFALLKLSGVPLSEPKYDRRFGHRKDYQEWKRNTPKFFPKLF